jgi:DNA-binding LytR/AlgR family response regulator
VLACVGDGLSAVRESLARRPTCCSWTSACRARAASRRRPNWPSAGPRPAGAPFPALVFVTAYDQYAVQAFEAQAVDYLLKPVQAARLQKAVQRLQQGLASRQAASATPAAVDLLEPALSQLRQLLAAQVGQPGAPAQPPPATPPQGGLRMIQASLSGGNGSIRLVPVDEVIYFEAADKYVRVLTASQEYLIRTPLKELIAQLDAQVFWQIHRGTLVRASAIDTVSRDEAGKLRISLRGHPDRLNVSRLYAHLFKAM